jgi:tRNA(fMet)-specific endonuclease VapC
MADRHYMLDTNIVSAVIRQPQSELAGHLARMPRDTFGISLIVAAELHYGALRKSSARLTRQVEAVLEGIDVLPLEEPVDRHYGEIRNELARQGHPIGHNDLLIAAHARALKLILVSDNLGEFSRVPGLTVENWLREPR